MTESTQQLLARVNKILARAEKVTPNLPFMAYNQIDRDFIAASRSDIPALCAALKELARDNELLNHSVAQWTKRAHEAEAMHATMFEESEQLRKRLDLSRWVIAAQGEGARACMISGDLHQSVHDFMCCCGRSWDGCRSEGVTKDVERLDDSDEWSQDDNGEDFSCSWEYETGSTILYRLDRVIICDDLAALPSPPQEAK